MQNKTVNVALPEGLHKKLKMWALRNEYKIGTAVKIMVEHGLKALRPEARP